MRHSSSSGRFAFGISLLLHLIIILIIVGVSYKTKKTNPVNIELSHVNHAIKARLVDHRVIEQAIAADQRRKQLEQEQVQARIRLAQARKKQELLRKKALAEKRREQIKKIEAANALAEKRRQEKIALEKRQKLEAKRIEQERLNRLAAERKRKQEERQQKLAQQKKERQAAKLAEQKKAAELAKKKLALEKKNELKRQAELMTQEIQKEKSHVDQSQAQAIDSMVLAYKQKMIAAIQQEWIIPDGTNKDLFAVLWVQLAPGGIVLDVRVIQSSGNAGLDRSARNAVLKASPLPVPKDPKLFEKFREIRLAVRPLHLMDN